MVPKEVVHRLGEPLGYVPYQLGDHTDWTTGPAEFGNLGLLTTRADVPVSFLQQGEPDFFLDGLWVGCLRGELVWVGSRSPETELYCDGQLVGVWEAYSGTGGPGWEALTVDFKNSICSPR